MSKEKGYKKKGYKKKGRREKRLVPKGLRRPKKKPAPAPAPAPQKEIFDYPAFQKPTLPPPSVVAPRPAQPSVVAPLPTGGDGTRSDSPGIIVDNSRHYHLDPHFHFDPRINASFTANFNPSIFGLGGGGGSGGQVSGAGPWTNHPPTDVDLENRFADLRSDVATDRYLEAAGGLSQGSDRLQQHLGNVLEENKQLKQKALLDEVEEVVKKGRKHLGLGAPKDEDPSRFTPEYIQELLNWAEKNLPPKK